MSMETEVVSLSVLSDVGALLFVLLVQLDAIAPKRSAKTTLFIIL